MAESNGRSHAKNQVKSVDANAVAEPEAKPLRPGQCRAYMRRTLAHEFRGIVDGFVKGARSGSCQHVKLATELLEPRPRAKRAPTGRRTILNWLDEVERGL